MSAKAFRPDIPNGKRSKHCEIPTSCPTSGGGWRHEQLGRRIWVLGATSAIAHAYARRRAERGASFLLLGRNEVHSAGSNAADLIARGVRGRLLVRCFDLARPLDYDAVVADLMVSERWLPIEVLIAYGSIGAARPRRSAILPTHAISSRPTSLASSCWLLAIIARWDRSQIPYFGRDRLGRR